MRECSETLWNSASRTFIPRINSTNTPYSYNEIFVILVSRVVIANVILCVNTQYVCQVCKRNAIFCKISTFCGYFSLSMISVHKQM